MNTSHPIFGELVTSNRLIRGGRWVFRGTIVPLDDVFADFASGLNLHEVWEKHGALDRRDLDAVATQALGEHVHALRKVSMVSPALRTGTVVVRRAEPPLDPDEGERAPPRVVRTFRTDLHRPVILKRNDDGARRIAVRSKRRSRPCPRSDPRPTP